MGLFDGCKPGLLFGALVGAWAALMLAAVNIRVPINDNIPNVLIPVSLLREGNSELSEFIPILQRETEGERYWAVRGENGLYSKYPIWTGVVAAPLFAPLVWCGAQVTNEDLWLRVGRVVAWILSGIFTGVLANIFRRSMPSRWAITLAFFVVFGSAIWHHLASHLTNQSVPLVCIALLLWLLTRRHMDHRKALAAGILSGLCVAARLPTVFVACLPLGIFLTHREWRRFIPCVTLGGLVFPSLTLIYNAIAFGSPLTTGYSFEAGQEFAAPLFEGLAGLLVSPTCGLLFYSPFLILGAWACAAVLRGEDTPYQRSLIVWVALSVVGQWLLLSRWYAWNGGLSYGSRMMVETVPGLALLIAAGWPALSRRPALKKLFLIAGVLAVGIHLAGTVTYDAIAATNPLKANWNFGADFLALYVNRFGPAKLATGLALAGVVLTGVFLAAGYCASRFLVRRDTPSSLSPEVQGMRVS